jgi:hypothetical protein
MPFTQQVFDFGADLRGRANAICIDLPFPGIQVDEPVVYLFYRFNNESFGRFSSDEYCTFMVLDLLCDRRVAVLAADA